MGPRPEVALQKAVIGRKARSSAAPRRAPIEGLRWTTIRMI